MRAKKASKIREPESGAGAHALQNLSEHRPLALNAQRLGVPARQRRFSRETSAAAQFEEFCLTPDTRRKRWTEITIMITIMIMTGKKRH
jgi:hypothetical protein